MASKRVVVPINPGTDADPAHYPKQGNYTQDDPPTQYLEKIGQQWMKARGEALPGTQYVLEALPAGYTVWGRPRTKTPSHIDRYLYGHPSHKAFDSTNRFFPHFEHLMNSGGSNAGCPCTLCSGTKGVLPKTPTVASSSGGASRQTKPKSRSKATVGTDTSRVDEEGNPDIFRNLIEKLKRYHNVDEIIKEPLSLDWRSEQQILPDWSRKLETQPQWTPRTGEIVLYLRQLPKGVRITRDDATRVFRMVDDSSGKSRGTPRWEAGIVGQTPIEPISLDDIIGEDDKEANVTYTGVRVEPLPNVNNTDKSSSKRYTYTSLRQVRPFVFWKQLLYKIPVSDWHVTIVSALTISSNLSLLGKYRFKGTWPDAQIYCRGVYIGHELFTLGDTVRVLPTPHSGRTTCTDIMVIKSIRLMWSNLDNASGNDWDDGRPYTSKVWIFGSAYTNDPSRIRKEWLSDENAATPKAAHRYGEWYPLHPASKELALPHFRILGRLFEHNAMSLWLDSEEDAIASLDTGREGIIEGRKFSREHDQRILANPSTDWFWGDSRSEALDLQTINGLDIAKYDQKRDPREFRKKIKVLEAMDDDDDNDGAVPPLNQQGVVPAAPSSNSEHSAAGTNPQAQGSTTSSPTMTDHLIAGKKRSRAIALSDDEGEGEGGDEDDIMHDTIMIEDGDTATGGGKSNPIVEVD